MVQLQGQMQQVGQLGKGARLGQPQRGEGLASWQPLRRQATRVIQRPAAPRGLEAQVRLSFSEGGESFGLELVEAGLRWARVKSALLLEVGQAVWVRGEGMAARAEVTQTDHVQGEMTLAWEPAQG